MNSFTKAHRLHNADDFSSVFVFRKVINGRFFKIHYKPNAFQNSRLGFMVSKKIHKRANQRNYMKRFIREYFRTHQHIWQPVDVIIRVQRYFSAANHDEVIAEIEKSCRRFNSTL